MAFKRQKRRAFEFSLRAPARNLPVLDQGPVDPFTSRYIELMSVSYFHKFYNANDSRCPSLRAEPTYDSAELMNDLGLIFKVKDTSFSVLLNYAKRERLLNYIARNCTERGCWSRLSFVLFSEDPYFINLSNLPLDFNQTRENLFFNNQQAHVNKRDEVVLNPGEFVTGELSLTTVPNQVAITFTGDEKYVMVRDISGEVVQCKSRYVPVGLTEEMPVNEITCSDVIEYIERIERYRIEQGKPPVRIKEVPQNTVYIDFFKLPEDKYTIDISSEYRPEAILNPEDVYDVLYTVPNPMPFAFVDLIFTNPDDGSGIFPISQVSAPPEDEQVNPVQYHLWFENRSTYWVYYIGLIHPEPVQELTIQDTKGSVKFLGPVEVTLADGRKAQRFISDQEIPLEQQSSASFELKGVIGRSGEKEIEVKRLPVAGVEQVYPLLKETEEPGFELPSEQAPNLSKIYVYV